MIQRGRKAAISLAVVTPITSVPRLVPPASLTDEQRAIWLETVNNRPADWFGAEQASLLECYCSHMANARMLRRILNAIEPEWLLNEEALQKQDKLFAMHERETKAAGNFATKLRLTSQSLTDKRVAGIASDRFKATRKPWQTEPDD